jgi:hypothetical protein
MLLGVGKRRKGGQDAEDQEEDDTGEDYRVVPKASVRSDADDEARGEHSGSILSLLPPSSPCHQQFPVNSTS